jgi:hypothetical protein
MSYSLLQVLHFWICIGAIWALWHVCWVSYCIDNVRSALFDIRSRLFFFAMDQYGLSFDHPAYTGLRNDINGMIRFAEKMGFLRALFVHLTVPGDMIRSTWRDALQGLPMPIQEQLLKFHQEAMVAVTRHVVRRSFLMATTFNATYFLVRLLTVGRRITIFVLSWRDTIGQSLEAQAREEYRSAA